MKGRDRRSRRKRTQARKNREKLKEIASATSRGTQRAVMFLGMLASFAGSLVAFLGGRPSMLPCCLPSPCSWERHS